MAGNRKVRPLFILNSIKFVRYINILIKNAKATSKFADNVFNRETQRLSKTSSVIKSDEDKRF